jgi:hypothetical protein
MRNSDRGVLLTVAVALVLAVAVLGYVAGHHRSASASEVHTRSAYAGNVLLAYSPGWRAAPAAPLIPGLSIAHPVVYAPAGDALRAGLISGELPGGQPAPLPSTFFTRLRGLPHTSVVSFVEGEGYRYSQLQLPGFNRALTLYVIPSAGGSSTVLACYASPALAADLRLCEASANTLRLAGQQQSYSLAPDASYAARTSQLIGALDRQRVALRGELSRSETLGSVTQLAPRLAGAFTAAARSLSSLEAPLAAGQAQAALSAAIVQARDAYTSLGAAAQAEASSSYEAAQKQVYEAEADVNTALESFALLGYSQVPGRLGAAH